MQKNNFKKFILFLITMNFIAINPFYFAFATTTTDGLIAEPKTSAENVLVPEPTPQIERIDENTITRSFEFTASERPFIYKFDTTFTLDNRQYSYIKDSELYFLKLEQPKLEIETKDFTKTEQKQNVSNQDDSIFDEFIFIEENGYTGTIPRISVSYNTTSKAGTSHKKYYYVDYGENTEQPIAEKSITKNGKTFSFEKWDISDSSWEENFYSDLNLTAMDRPIATLQTGKKINLDSDSPSWSKIKDDLLIEMHLDLGSHIIHSAQWTNSLQQDESFYSRKIRFTIARNVRKYIAVYSTEIAGDSVEQLNAQATYQGTLNKEIENGIEYIVVCTVQYSAPPLPTPVPTPTPEPTPTVTPTETNILEQEIIEEKPKKKNSLLFFFITGLVIIGGVVVFIFIKNKFDDDEHDNDNSENNMSDYEEVPNAHDLLNINDDEQNDDFNYYDDLPTADALLDYDDSNDDDDIY